MGLLGGEGTHARDSPFTGGEREEEMDGGGCAVQSVLKDGTSCLLNISIKAYME